jgi:hypothetical protein
MPGSSPTQSAAPPGRSLRSAAALVLGSHATQFGTYAPRMTADQLLAHLRDTAAPVEHAHGPAAPGVYGWFLDDPKPIPSLPNQGTDPVYVGISADLARRGDEDHFRSGGSGVSTLRRSLGALLKDELKLTAQPRSPGLSEQNFRCYRFDDPGEQRLTTGCAGISGSQSHHTRLRSRWRRS